MPRLIYYFYKVILYGKNASKYCQEILQSQTAFSFHRLVGAWRLFFAGPSMAQLEVFVTLTICKP